MKLMQRIKQAFGGRILRKEIEPVRLRGGSNFRSAQFVGILYIDESRETFEQLRDYCQYLRTKYNIKMVHMLGFVNSKNKKLPDYQRQLVDSEYFTKNDLNWHMRPVNNVSNFLNQPFDILIDFSGGNSVPIIFLIKESMAKMKVGLRGSKAERYCDFIIDMGNQFGLAKYTEQLDMYLSNSRIK